MTITLPDYLRNIVRRIAGLQPGQYFVSLNVSSNEIDYSVQRVGPIEVGDMPSIESLSPGRYVAVMTVTADGMCSHTLRRVGKVEK